MNWNHLAKASIVMVAAAACFGAQASTNGISVTIAPEKTKLNANEDVVVKVSITNTSSQPQYVLKSHTPFVELEEGLFEITRDGARVAYEGAHYKRPAPTADDYFLLKPGATHTAKVELSGVYDMSITGDYSIRYNVRSMNLFSSTLGTTGLVGAEKQMGSMDSPAVSLWIDGRYARGTHKEAAAPVQSLTGSLAFNKCTATQQSSIVSAVSAATTYASNADAYMQAGVIGSRYTKWFGASTSTRNATVKAHYVAIKDAFQNKPITVDCGCKKTYYAYVYPTQPYTIYVCKAFWSAPMTGTDSKGGTLVHEMSHFNVTASTDDRAYGQTAAASLAISDPDGAIDNADSHEYFGENTPALN